MIKRTQCPSVVIVPWLSGVKAHRRKSFDRQNNYDPVGNHIQWVFLSHTPPTMENIRFPIPFSQDKIEVVTISVKNKTSSRQP